MRRDPSGHRALLLIDHGSRLAEANQQLETVASLLREREPGLIVRTAHLAIEPPTLAEAVDDCVRSGARQIVVHPFFLGPGRHTRCDIPRLVEAARALHPELGIAITGPLGAHSKLIDVILERIQELD